MERRWFESSPEDRPQSRPYKDGEFDILIGYDLFTDTAYVWLDKEVKKGWTRLPVSQEAAERWDKLMAFS